MNRSMMIALMVLGSTTTAATAQEAVIACQSQQELEQVIASDGRILPDGCRNVSITPLDNGGERLCLMDFAGDDDGIVSQLREVAVNEAWWVRCADLNMGAPG